MGICHQTVIKVKPLKGLGTPLEDLVFKGRDFEYLGGQTAKNIKKP